MERGKQLEIVNKALGEAAQLLMSQEVKGTEMVMPAEDLARIAESIVDELGGAVDHTISP